ncbi:Metallo-dependent hydrolase [Trichoderma velutinum]
MRDYYEKRRQLVEQEKLLAFDWEYRMNASGRELVVDNIIRRVKDWDVSNTYDRSASKEGYQGQSHSRFAGDHFLSNISLIEQTKMFKIITQMPKGAHLHIHFNACLSPKILLDVAKGMDRMFIMSNLPLTSDNNFENFDKCEIKFSIKPPQDEKPGNLFDANYQAEQTMKFAAFVEQFPRTFNKSADSDVDTWLLGKLLFNEHEVYEPLRTVTGAWKMFNSRTKMMKGLFNYEKAFRLYTRLCLEDFLRDNIQYAEIRPNFMASNRLYKDDGSLIMSNSDTIKIIIDEVTKFQKKVASSGDYFGGLKIIYCTARSSKPSEIEAALTECLEFKRIWPGWIAGFDLVGEEAKGKPLKDFVPQLLQFQENCKTAGVEIPFLFHCGETLEEGSEIDGNLIDALLLGSKRIGHGFALVKRPLIMKLMKEEGVCVEVCPISNEILGLNPRVSGHPVYQLLANNVHCTINSDNGALFRSSLSHDFYQIMVGKSDIGLYHFKKLIIWSIEHSCLGGAEKAEMLEKWKALWEGFLLWVIEKYSDGEFERDERDM